MFGKPSVYGMISGFLALALLLTFSLPAWTAPGDTTRVSIATDGTPGNAISDNPDISADGRFVAFASTATNLVPGDTNGSEDVFVRDRQTGETTRVSIATGGTAGNAGSTNPAISGDGRYVAFESSATTLILTDTNAVPDVFVHDRETGITERVSVASNGDEGNNRSGYPAISANGRYVAFWSRADNLVSGDTNSEEDVFVHDRQTGITERVSVASDGTQGDDDATTSAISADGRYVAFLSRASTLVSGDTNNTADIFVHDRAADETERVSVATDGTEADSYSDAPDISADGRFVIFESRATNLVSGDTNARSDIFIHDRQMGTTARLSETSGGIGGDNHSEAPTISADGRYAAFESRADNLIPEDINPTPYNDILIRDLQTGSIERASVATDGSKGDLASEAPSISAGGQYVAFSSSSTNLVSDDDNSASDCFVHETGALDPLGLEASTLSVDPDEAAVGEVVTFTMALVNDGVLTTGAAFTDTLPTTLRHTGTPAASTGAAPAVNGATLTWSGVISAMHTVTLTYSAELTSTAASATAASAPRIVNEVVFVDGFGTAYTRSVVINERMIFLPLVLR